MATFDIELRNPGATFNLVLSTTASTATPDPVVITRQAVGRSTVW